MVAKAIIDLMFQHAAARRRLGLIISKCLFIKMFQHAAARRRLASGNILESLWEGFQHAAARRRLAGCRAPSVARPCFNTQPPEGGW